MQLLMICVNFVYGIIIFFVTVLNYFFIKNETILVKILLTILFVVDFTILYLIIIYKINYGIFHIYYLISFVLGFYLAYLCKKRVKVVTIKEKIIDIKKH